MLFSLVILLNDGSISYIAMYQDKSTVTTSLKQKKEIVVGTITIIVLY